MAATRYVMVGDPHGEAGDLEDLSALLGLVERVCRETGAPPLFLGDEYDTHAIIHAEVMKVWFDFLSRWPRAILMRGNHDGPARTTTGATALLAHAGQCRVVLDPTVIGGVLFLPHTRDPAEFVSWCLKHGDTRTVICHQAFEGSRYETGYYAKGEARPDQVPQELIVSGHVHAPAEFGQVWHPGAPRWRVEADAEIEERFLWLVEFDGAGKLESRTPFETSPAVRRIRRLVDSPSSPAPLGPWPDKDEVRVDVRGPRTYVDARAPLHEAAGALVRRLPDAAVASEVRESDGLSRAWGKWVGGFKAPRGTPAPTLIKMVKERVGEAAALTE